MNVVPSESYEAVLDSGETGLVGTVGIELVDNVGGTTQAFSTSNIIETPPGSGVYAATRVAPAAVGQYSIVWSSGGEVIGVEDLLVLGASPEPVLVPPVSDDWLSGPCANWISGDDVLDCCEAGVGTHGELLDDVAALASGLLYEISGRRYNGICQRTVRPCRQTCGCFGRGASSYGPIFGWDNALGYWRDEGDSTRCGCGRESIVRLSGYPVRTIVEVKIGGVAVDASGYRLVGNRELLRMDDPGPPVVKHFWPVCQNVALNDTEAGTFSVTYTHGIAPPALGRSAAAQLACELWKACPGTQGECALPSKVTKVVRQGITIEKLVPLAEFLAKGATGLQLVDAFIAQANPYGIRRRPAVFSPDVQPFAKRY